MTREVDVAIIGAGSAGLAALAQVKRETDNYVLINGGELGTTCARVGCMPSKAAIQVADTFHYRTLFDRFGITQGDDLAVDREETLEHIRDMRDVFVDQVLTYSTDEMSDEFIDGYATITGTHTLKVNGETVRAKRIILCTGSQPVVPDTWQQLGDRILTTDNLFEQENLPDNIAVIGLGVIGLELGQFMSRIGIHVQGFDMATQIAGLQDPAINEMALQILQKEFPMHLGQPVEMVAQGGLLVTAGDVSFKCDKALVCIGRKANLAGLGLEALGLQLNDRNLPPYNPATMQIDGLPVFLAGDITQARPILHEATDEGKIAGYNAVREDAIAFRRRIQMLITFSDPNIVLCGETLEQLDENEIVIGQMRLAPLGRALIMGKNKGLLRIYVNKKDGLIRGASMIGPKGESLIQLITLAIQCQLTVFDFLRMPFYHPTIEEAIQSALRDAARQVDYQPEGIQDLETLINPN